MFEAIKSKKTRPLGYLRTEKKETDHGSLNVEEERSRSGKVEEKGSKNADLGVNRS